MHVKCDDDDDDDNDGGDAGAYDPQVAQTSSPASWARM